MSKTVVLKVKKLKPDAELPVYAYPGDAGLDFFSYNKVTIPPGEIRVIPSGISIKIPDGYFGMFWSKSSLLMNHSIKVLRGVIDSSFRGEVVMGVINRGKKSYTFEKGHKVAQLVIQPVIRAKIVEVKKLSRTKRGHGKLGSTGK